MADSPPTGQTDPHRWLSEHGDAMYRYALLRLADPDAAADAVQEALLGAMRSRDSFRGDAQERTWLIGILRHKVLDAIRSRQRQLALDGAAEPGDDTFRHGTFRSEPTLWDGLPGSPGERQELRELLASCIQRLPDQMRQALCLREIDGLGTDEICKILSITPTNLWTLVHRAKIRLREDISVRWFGDDR